VEIVVEGSTLSLLGGLLPIQHRHHHHHHHHQQQQQVPGSSASSSLSLLSTPQVTLSRPSSAALMDILDQPPEAGRDQPLQDRRDQPSEMDNYQPLDPVVTSFPS